MLGHAGAGDGEVGCCVEDPKGCATADPGSLVLSTSESVAGEIDTEDPKQLAIGATCAAEGDSCPSTDRSTNAGDRHLGDRSTA
jgi:hypothetical protein